MNEAKLFMGLVKPRVSRKHMKKGEIRTSVDMSTYYPMDDMTIPDIVNMLMGWAKFLEALSLQAGRENEHGGVDIELDGDYHNIPSMSFDATYYGGDFDSQSIDCGRHWIADKKGKYTTTITIDDPELAAMFAIPNITLGEIARLRVRPYNNIDPWGNDDN